MASASQNDNPENTAIGCAILLGLGLVALVLPSIYSFLRSLAGAIGNIGILLVTLPVLWLVAWAAGHFNFSDSRAAKLAGAVTRQHPQVVRWTVIVMLGFGIWAIAIHKEFQAEIASVPDLIVAMNKEIADGKWVSAGEYFDRIQRVNPDHPRLTNARIGIEEGVEKLKHEKETAEAARKAEEEKLRQERRKKGYGIGRGLLTAGESGGGGEVLVFSSSGAIKGCAAEIKDLDGAGPVCANGLLTIEKAGRRVKELDTSGWYSFVKIRVLEGPNRGLIGWIFKFNYDIGKDWVPEKTTKKESAILLKRTHGAAPDKARKLRHRNVPIRFKDEPNPDRVAFPTTKILKDLSTEHSKE